MEGERQPFSTSCSFLDASIRVLEDQHPRSSLTECMYAFGMNLIVCLQAHLRSTTAFSPRWATPTTPPPHQMVHQPPRLETPTDNTLPLTRAQRPRAQSMVALNLPAGPDGGLRPCPPRPDLRLRCMVGTIPYDCTTIRSFAYHCSQCS